MHRYYSYYYLFFIGFSLVFCKPNQNDSNSEFLLFALAESQINRRSSPGCPSTEPLPAGVHFANTLVFPTERSHRPFGDPNLAINGVCGAGQFAGSLDVYELERTGSRSKLILKWKEKLVQNVPGVDFIIFENVFQNQGSQNTYFVEPLVVSVSLDGDKYCGFDPEFTPGSENPATQIRNDWKSFAGLTPVLYNWVSNPLSPTQIFSGEEKQPDGGKTYYMRGSGGDGFDLEDLSSTGDGSDVGSPESECDTATITEIQTEGFQFLRLESATQYGYPTPQGSFTGGPDIDGVIARKLVDHSLPE